jgi:hypothetical protein
VTLRFFYPLASNGRRFILVSLRGVAMPSVSLSPQPLMSL